MAKVLIIDDDQELVTMVVDWLTHEHFQVESVHTGRDAEDRLRFYQYDVVILDWQLPDLTGIEILSNFRRTGGKTPVIMLTGRQSVSDKEAGLDAGADDYIPKPFHVRELAARIRAVVRRSTGEISNVLVAGSLVLDPVKHTVTKDGEDIRLQRREFALLEFLMRNPNRVFSSEALLERVWSSESDATPEAIRTCLKRLRQKIDTDGTESLIKNEHGVGYRLQPPSA